MGTNLWAGEQLRARGMVSAAEQDERIHALVAKQINAADRNQIRVRHARQMTRAERAEFGLEDWAPRQRRGRRA